jgi:hypothetical protein
MMPRDTHEAPYAYKGIAPSISTLEQAGIARVVAELRPFDDDEGVGESSPVHVQPVKR